MFESVISVKELVDELKNTEVDIALEIPNKTYVSWLNSLQQLIYSEVIKEQRKITLETSNGNHVNISSIEPGEGESKMRFEDIHTIYAKFDDNTNVQLIKSTVTSGVIFLNAYYKENNNIGYHTKGVPKELTIIYHVRPALITVSETDDIDGSKVMLPDEFIDLAKAKLRGEAYKLANEDGIAAKWLNDYNVLLETFKAWISSRTSNLGM